MTTMRARVYVTLKPSVFDPQGNTIHEALHGMGYAAVSDVRQGKFFDLTLEAGDPAGAQALVEELARKVLANPVIESFRTELLP